MESRRIEKRRNKAIKALIIRTKNIDSSFGEIKECYFKVKNDHWIGCFLVLEVSNRPYFVYFRNLNSPYLPMTSSFTLSNLPNLPPQQTLHFRCSSYTYLCPVGQY